MAPTTQHTQPKIDHQAVQDTFRAFVQEQVRNAIRATFIDILEEEVAQFIGAGRYERTAGRRDQRAGHRHGDPARHPCVVKGKTPVARRAA